MWPKNGNPEIARSLPRQRSLPVRFESEEAMAFNGIIYNNLLHEREVKIEVEDLINALSAFCEESGIDLDWRKMKNYGRGGMSSWTQLGITINRTIPRVFAASTLIHEIAHCLGHLYKNARGYYSYSDIPGPVREAEAYLVEYRVLSFFFPEKLLYETPTGFEVYEYRKDFNARLYWYGPKRNVQMIREEQCVEFADDLICWIIDELEL